jgi:Zn-dependent protease
VVSSKRYQLQHGRVQAGVMRDLLNLNLSLGRWGGVQIRLHAFFVLFALVAFYLSTQDAKNTYFVESAAILVVLFLSVLAHEMGHCLAAWRVGGSADQICIWPLGGLAQVHVPHEPQHELIAALAGPAVNLGACTFFGILLWLLGEERVNELEGVLNPLVPPSWPVDGLGALGVLRWTVWINWLMLVVNLLPAFPLDGGRALRALLWQKLDFRRSVLAVARVAQVMAVCLGAAAWWLQRADAAHGSAALALLLLSVLVFFSAKLEADRVQVVDPDEALFGYDFSHGYTSLERANAAHRPSPGVVRKWLDDRRARRTAAQLQIEAEEERRVDDVLARLHESGLETLSDADRALLDRVSARYRNRQRG